MQKSCCKIIQSRLMKILFYTLKLIKNHTMFWIEPMYKFVTLFLLKPLSKSNIMLKSFCEEINLTLNIKEVNEMSKISSAICKNLLILILNF